MEKKSSIFNPTFFNPTLKQLAEFKILAEQGDPKSQFHLGICFAYGKGCSLNIETAVEWINLAADNGDNDAIAFQNNINYGTRIKTLAKYICYTEALLMSIIMVLTICGNKVARDIITGGIIREYFGLFGVAFLYLLNLVVVFKILVWADKTDDNESTYDKNIERAVFQTKTLIETSESDDLYNLGEIYLNSFLKGSLIPHNFDNKEAFKWFKLAADKGHDLAKYKLTIQENCLENDYCKKESNTTFWKELLTEILVSLLLLLFLLVCLFILKSFISLSIRMDILIYFLFALFTIDIIKFLVRWVRKKERNK